MTTEAEKVELEQVPLKADTDEKPAEVTGAVTEIHIDKKQAPKKTWFFQKDKKKSAVTTEEGAAPAAEEKEKKEKKCFWQRCKKSCEEGEQKPECMTIGIDMQMRDERAVNDHAKINFEDVFGEPDPFHSWDCAWRCVYRIFECTRVFFYRLFSLIIGIPSALIFGLLFGLVVSLNVFVIVPIAKLLSIPFNWLALGWAWLAARVFDPLTRSCGLCFSSVHVRKYGLNNAPTDLIQA